MQSNAFGDTALRSGYGEEAITAGDWCLIGIALLTNAAVALRIFWAVLGCLYGVWIYLHHALL